MTIKRNLFAGGAIALLTVSGFTVGHVLNAAIHGLAFTAEAANRVNVLSAANPSQAGVPVSVHFAAVGPNQVVALDVELAREDLDRRGLRRVKAALRDVPGLLPIHHLQHFELGLVARQVLLHPRLVDHAAA